MSPSDITAHLHKEFPLARYMQVEAAAWDQRTLTLTAPLEPNVNHSDTAFGGAISTLGILAGYTLLYLALKERQISTRILIQQSTTDFRRPIDAALSATATLPEDPVFIEFLAGITKKRRARITTESQILCHKAPAAIHTGTFVAILY